LSPLDAFWHVLNFFGPAIGVGLLSAALAKLLWRRELKAASWLRLAAWAAGAGALASIASLVLLGRDGKMLGYGAVLLACTLALWWVGFKPLRR
jgi:hypothetical protein